MISFRLWRSISDAASDDPIFRRASQFQRSAPTPSRRRRRLPRLLLLPAVLALVAAVVHSPGLLVLLLLVPILLIMLMVASPVLLPLYAWAAGARLTSEVINGIFREKHQYTYDLICASTRGALAASWSFATGILHCCDWFTPLRWGTRLTMRAGMALLGGLSVFALLAAIAGGQAFGFEQARLLLMATLLLALYYSNMTQTLALSLVVGLYASSFDLSRQDSMLIGLFLYALLSLLPLLAGALVLVAFGMLAVEPGPAARMLVEAGALLLAVGAREGAIGLLWRGLGRRLEWGVDRSSQRQLVRRSISFSVAP